MKLTYLGHSALYIETQNHRLIIDPFIEGNPLCPVHCQDLEVDFVVLTHAHGDHFTGGLDLPHQRTDRLTAGPWLAGDCVRGPAGSGEGFHQLATEASIAAQNDGGVAHFVLPWSPAAAGDWCLLR